MTPIEALMRQWLESGDPAKVTHARNRLAIGFGPAPPVAEAPPAPSVPLALSILAARCPLRVRDPSCGCAGRGCAMAGKPTTDAACLACVTPLHLAATRGLPSPETRSDG